MSNNMGLNLTGGNSEFQNDEMINVAGTNNETAGETEQASDKLNAFQAKVSDNLSNIAGKVHERSDTAQEFLSEKTDKLNVYAHQTVEAAGRFGHRAADALDASSGYVKNFDITETRQQVMDTIKQRPEISLAVAGIFGLLVGLMIGRSSKNILR